jgi:PAS domain S-box-containing protein
MREIPKEHLQMLLDMIPFPIFIKNIQMDFTYVLWNEAAHKAWGFNRIEIIGKTDFHFFPLEQAQFFRDKDIEAASTKGKVFIAEEPIVTKDGRVMWLKTWKNVIMDEKQEPLYLVGVSQDITALKQAEKKIREMEKKPSSHGDDGD